MDGTDEFNDIRIVTRRLKQLAQRYNVAIIQLAQATRGNKYDRVGLEDIGLSISIVQDSDLLMTLNLKRVDRRRFGTLKHVEWWCEKNRHGEEGWMNLVEANPDYGEFAIIKGSGIDHSQQFEDKSDDGSASIAAQVLG